MTEPDGVRLASAAAVLRARYKRPPAQHGFAVEFEHIWAKYPKKIGKDMAFKAYVARRREGIEPRKLYDATVLYAKQRHGQDDKFTMRAMTFFGPDKRWMEPFEASQTNGHARHAAEVFDLTKVMGEPPAKSKETETDPDSVDPLRDL